MPDDLERVYTTAMRILNHRFNSEGELRRKLRAKQFADDVIDPTIQRLRAEGWLDDERFTAAYVRTRTARRVGPLRIRRELGAAGVDRDVIQQAMEANKDGDAERATLEELCAKRLRLLARRHGEEYAASSEGRQKIAAYLVRQGYELGEVLAVIRKR